MKRILSTKYLFKYRLTIYFGVISILVTAILFTEFRRCIKDVPKSSSGLGPVLTSRGQLTDVLPERTCEPHMRRQVILLTYGRSGSSLTTDIIQHEKQVYTYFEPLHNLAKSYVGKQEKYMKAYKKYLPLTSLPDYLTQAENIVRKLMTCDYHQLPLVASKNPHMRFYDSAPMFHCMRRSTTPQGEAKCLQQGQKTCLKKLIHFLKIIRLTTESVGHLMSSYPCLQMIYLVRDPRGTFMSKKRAFVNISVDTKFEGKKFCQRVDKDIDHALKLLKAHPGRVCIARYEDIAERPEEMSRKLYTFLRLNLTDDTLKFVFNRTQSGVINSDIFSTFRANSTEVSYAWRSRMKYHDAALFDEICREVYYKLGYLPVNTLLHLRDRRKPLKFTKTHLL
ncbi:carbohydrate sulfotransferase 3-like isoform X1 [Biomphalaria pfeifferi]|uniref:Carbohydrate sulfotransferase 3-like isoform X1 n=1 Tax=Biomphalaria pfeifferi TaxID=112525 RepID=A0AAD8FK72_BIOPF|nr:carbohydrate sulfotransferase 3-like isoform X1 [Biomphalaria pfeifferi]